MVIFITANEDTLTVSDGIKQAVKENQPNSSSDGNLPKQLIVGVTTGDITNQVRTR